MDSSGSSSSGHSSPPRHNHPESPDSAETEVPIAKDANLENRASKRTEKKRKHGGTISSVHLPDPFVETATPGDGQFNVTTIAGYQGEARRKKEIPSTHGATERSCNSGPGKTVFPSNPKYFNLQQPLNMAAPPVAQLHRRAVSDSPLTHRNGSHAVVSPTGNISDQSEFRRNLFLPDSPIAVQQQPSGAMINANYSQYVNLSTPVPVSRLSIQVDPALQKSLGTAAPRSQDEDTAAPSPLPRTSARIKAATSVKRMKLEDQDNDQMLNSPGFGHLNHVRNDGQGRQHNSLSFAGNLTDMVPAQSNPSLISPTYPAAVGPSSVSPASLTGMPTDMVPVQSNYNPLSPAYNAAIIQSSLSSGTQLALHHTSDYTAYNQQGDNIVQGERDVHANFGQSTSNPQGRVAYRNIRPRYNIYQYPQNAPMSNQQPYGIPNLPVGLLLYGMTHEYPAQQHQDFDSPVSVQSSSQVPPNHNLKQVSVPECDHFDTDLIVDESKTRICWLFYNHQEFTEWECIIICVLKMHVKHPEDPAELGISDNTITEIMKWHRVWEVDVEYTCDGVYEFLVDPQNGRDLHVYTVITSCPDAWIAAAYQMYNNWMQCMARVCERLDQIMS